MVVETHILMKMEFMFKEKGQVFILFNLFLMILLIQLFPPI